MLARFHASRAIEFINREIEKKTEHERERERKEKWKKRKWRAYDDDDDDDDNVERLLTKIEVVVMTGIGRDDALREGRDPCRLSQLLEKDFRG